MKGKEALYNHLVPKHIQLDISIYERNYLPPYTPTDFFDFTGDSEHNDDIEIIF